MEFFAYIATSLDGFIARPDGGLDWLPKPQEGGEDYGYGEFFAAIDAIVMGRNTFDTVLSFGQWSYADKRMWVLSSRELESPEFVPQPSHAGPAPSMRWWKNWPRRVCARYM